MKINNIKISNDDRYNMIRNLRVDLRIIDALNHLVVVEGFNYYVLKNRSGKSHDKLFNETKFIFMGLSDAQMLIKCDVHKFHKKNLVIYKNLHFREDKDE